MNAGEAFRSPPERRDARESPSRSFTYYPFVSPNTMNMPIPVYRPDGSLYAYVSEERLVRLQSAGLVARVVRHRKGHVNRVILFNQPGEPGPMPAGAYSGTRYSFREQLESGARCWRLKYVGDRHSFYRVIRERLNPP